MEIELLGSVISARFHTQEVHNDVGVAVAINVQNGICLGL